MVIRLTAEEVCEAWPTFGPVIAEALPPMVMADETGMTNILRAILADDLQVWVLLTPERTPRAVATTSVVTDKVIGGRYLLLYTFTGLELMDNKEEMIAGIEVLKDYAREMGCYTILGYSNQEGMPRFAAALGADASYHTLIFEV